MKRGIKIWIFAFVAILLIYVIMAASTPTTLRFNNNVTSNYDEGNFFVNWTASGNAAANYTIYRFSNSTFYGSAQNSSATGYTFSNTTQANYTFKVEGWNTTGTKANATSNISIFVDSSQPTISLSSYTNATLKNTSSQLTLNISVSDGNSGTTGTVCLIDVNGTNQTITFSSGWCNGTIGLTGTSNGNNFIKIYANDTVNNVGLNDSYAVLIDSGVPTASASCSPSTVYEGDDFPCSCSGTDASSITTSSSSDSPDGTAKPTTQGVYTYTCVVTDAVGNAASSTATYAVLHAGGGSAAVIPPQAKNEHLWTKITPGAATIMQDFNPVIGIKQIEITVNNEAQNVQIIVIKYDSKPANVSVSKTGKVYQYLHIDTRNLQTNLDKAVVEFRVPKSWANTNNVDKGKIAVYKFDASTSKWNELSSTFVSEDADYYYYNTELSSFSYFVISERSLVAGEGTTATGETPTTAGSKLWLWILVILVIGAAVWLGMKKKSFLS